MIDKSKLYAHQQISASLEIPYKNIDELFKCQVKKAPNKEFLIAPGKITDRFTYEKFRDSYVQVAKFLKAMGLKKGDRINLIIPNSPEFLFLYFASIASGITVVPINQDISPAEILYVVKDSLSKAVFYHENLSYKIDEIKDNIKDNRLIQISDYPNFKPLVEVFAADNEFSPSDVGLIDEAVIIYTSGTTGNPKGVVLTHLNLLSDAKAISDWFCFNNKTRTLCILPLFHNNGQVVTLLAPLYSGGSTVIVKGKASLMAFWGLIDKYKVNWTSIMSSILSILLSMSLERKDNTMKGIICGGQILTSNVQQSFEKRFSIPIFEGFGLTETTSFASFNEYPEEKRKPGSVGKALPVNEIVVMDEKGQVLDDNEEGEICLRGFNIANEYLSIPERNAESFKDGWFHTGDYGYKDKDGYLFFKGRKDFLIIKGGENIYPAELENILFMHPAVAEVAVIGIPDILLGEDIAAFVKLNEGVFVKLNELKDYCKNKIAKFKQPKEIYIIDELIGLNEIPKGPTKKVLYNKLTEYYKKNYS